MTQSAWVGVDVGESVCIARCVEIGRALQILVGGADGAILWG